MKITPEIQEAIRKAIDLHGNVTQLAKHLGIAHSTVLFWLSGKTTEVSGRLWAQKLRPSLLPFLGASAFANRPLGKGFFQPEEERPAGYEPWQDLAEIPNGVPVRLKSSRRVLGVLKCAPLESIVEKPVGIFDGHEIMRMTPTIALDLLEVLGDGEWLPAGKRTGAA